MDTVRKLCLEKCLRFFILGLITDVDTILVRWLQIVFFVCVIRNVLFGLKLYNYVVFLNFTRVLNYYDR